MTVSAPPLRYHGSKWRLYQWLQQHFPPHRIYVEPFGGAAPVLLQKPRVESETAPLQIFVIDFPVGSQLQANDSKAYRKRLINGV